MNRALAAFALAFAAGNFASAQAPQTLTPLQAALRGVQMCSADPVLQLAVVGRLREFPLDRWQDVPMQDCPPLQR